MRNHIPFTKPSILHLLGLRWEDKDNQAHFSQVYVGNDKPLSLKELEHVAYVWLGDGIEQKAKGLLGFTLLETFTL